MDIKSRLLQILRDPVWQFVGVVLAFVGLWAATVSTPTKKSTLSIFHQEKVQFADYRLPTDRVRLVLNGSNQEVSGAVVDYFVIYNGSERPILPVDISSPIRISKAAHLKKIFLVATCPELPRDKVNNPTATQVALAWHEAADSWVAQPALLNPGDYSCVTVISEESAASNDSVPASERFRWDARIVNVQLRTFDTYEDFTKTWEKHLPDYLGAEIHMTGYAPYWFAAVQLVLFFGTMTLARRAGWISSLGRSDLIKSAAVVGLATGSAETLVYLFTTSLPLSRLHPASVAFLLVHSAIAVLMYRSSLNERIQRDQHRRPS